MNESDDHWLAQAREGNAVAFRRLVEPHTRPLYGLCARITRDTALAEDAVQEAMFNAWRHLPSFDGRAGFRTWLHRIAVNAALEQLRRRGRHDKEVEVADSEDDFLGEFSDERPGPERQAMGSEIHRRTEAQLDRMSAIERTAFVMRHNEGHSLEEIAQVLRMNTNACKQAIFRAVRKLRVALEPLR
jgi:RNA polymerase sigma-70 factor (ECF subfamily)